MKIFTLMILLVFTQIGWAQSVVEDISQGIVSQRVTDPFDETILLIGQSKKIFVLSNRNGNLHKGDFISLLVDDNLAVRALVAKVEDERAGIKILKIYSLKQWVKLKKGKQIKVLIGDDSYYRKPEEVEEEVKDDQEDLKNLGINSEEDLFNDSVTIDDMNVDEKTGRHIKTDNIIHLSWGPFRFYEPLNQDLSISENKRNYNEYSGGWAYQISDNIYLEGVLGYISMEDFPSKNSASAVITGAIRFKYNFALPLYFYVMPFAGYRISRLDSPDAGKQNDDNTIPAAQLANEQTLVEYFEEREREFIVGATILRRFVPGWFFKADLEFSLSGNLRYNFGMAVEF
ncbi:MAG: hypothetical protein H6620_11595 [Halobacteriovoraceae bacterium]|nr:hypothetical protein [Halobacteriovoraceae bacterium]